MVIRIDPEENEIRALVGMADFSGKRVLEIGCGDGRLTWRYAGRAAQVTAIDPLADRIKGAEKDLPDDLRDRVELRQVTFEDFAEATGPAAFDIAILSWSL